MKIHIEIENGVVLKFRTIDNRNKDVKTRKLSLKNLPGLGKLFDDDDDL